MSDPRAGTGIYKMNLEHLMVLECKEMLRKTRQSISLFSMSVSPLLPVNKFFSTIFLDSVYMH